MKAVLIMTCLLSLSCYGMEQKLSCCKRRLKNFAFIIALLEQSKITFEQPKTENPKMKINKINAKL